MKGIIIVVVVIFIGYLVGIFCVGVFIKWSSVLVGDNVNLVNVVYVVMNNLGFILGNLFGLSNLICI